MVDMTWLIGVALLIGVFLLGAVVFRIAMRNPNTRNGLSGNGFSEDGLPPNGAV